MINEKRHFLVALTLIFVLATSLSAGMFGIQFVHAGEGGAIEYIVANADAIEGNAPRTAEIIYSNLNSENGNITYSLQIWINREKLLSEASPSEKDSTDLAINEVFSSLSNYFTEKGYTIAYKTDPDNLLDITLASYSSRHQMAVDNPNEDGYEAYDPFENLVKWGFFRSLYSTTSLSVFSNISDTVIEKAINILMEFDLFEKSDIIYIFNYGTSISPKTIYSNSDTVYYSSKYKMHIHEFSMTEDQLDSKYITLYQKSYNSLGWNLTLIAFTVISIVVFLSIMRKKRNKTINE